MAQAYADEVRFVRVAHRRTDGLWPDSDLATRVALLLFLRGLPLRGLGRCADVTFETGPLFLEHAKDLASVMGVGEAASLV